MKSELDMQDDEVFKQIFIPGYGVSDFSYLSMERWIIQHSMK